MESLLIARDKPIRNTANSYLPLELFKYILLYDVYLSHCTYTIVVCSVFIIILQALYFIINRM